MSAAEPLAIKPDQAVRPLRDTQTPFDRDLTDAADRALQYLRERGHDNVRIVELFAAATVKQHLGSARAISVPPIRNGGEP